MYIFCVQIMYWTVGLMLMLMFSWFKKKVRKTSWFYRNRVKRRGMMYVLRGKTSMEKYFKMLKRQYDASYKKNRFEKIVRSGSVFLYYSWMYKLSENYKVLHEINLIISLKLIITYNLSHKYIATCYGDSLLYYYACVFTVNRTHTGLAKILLYMFVDKNIYFLLLPGNSCSKILK